MRRYPPGVIVVVVAKNILLMHMRTPPEARLGCSGFVYTQSKLSAKAKANTPDQIFIAAGDRPHDQRLKVRVPLRLF